MTHNLLIATAAGDLAAGTRDLIDVACELAVFEDRAGRTAVVNGGPRGLGLSMATGLAAHGVSIALLDLLPEGQCGSGIAGRRAWARSGRLCGRRDRPRRSGVGGRWGRLARTSTGPRSEGSLGVTRDPSVGAVASIDVPTTGRAR